MKAKFVVLFIGALIISFVLMGCRDGNSYKVTFDGNGGALISGEEIQEVKKGENAIAPIFEKEGFALSWDKEFENIKSDLHVKAIWTPLKLEVRFISGGGKYISGEEIQEIEYNHSAIAPVYEKEGYFLTWDVSFDNVKTDLVVTAVWLKNEFTVEFVGSGGNYVSGEVVQKIKKGESAVAPVFEKEGFELSWDISFDNVKADLVVNAIWSAKKFTVTFDGSGGVLLGGNEVQEVEGGSAAVAPVYYKEGYILSFDKDFSRITEDLSVVAVWSLYLRVNEENKTDPLGQYLLFGEFPQTIKEADVEIDLENQNSLGYYLGSDGHYYASLVGKSYMPHTYFSNGELILEQTTYYFKVEPIRWRILLDGLEEFVLYSEKALTTKKFHESTDIREYGGKTIYPNNYEHSDLRTWLNEVFYNNYFSQAQRALIIEGSNDNSVKTTGYSSNQYACANTIDRFYIPSYADLTNADYGFSTDYMDQDPMRQHLATDYVRGSEGSVSTIENTIGLAQIWVRSPINWQPNNVRGTFANGHVGNNPIVTSRIISVAPMVKINKE